MLQQVGTLLVDQTVRMHEFLAFRAAGGDEQQRQWQRQRFDLDSHPKGRASARPSETRLSHLPRPRGDNALRGVFENAARLFTVSGGMAPTGLRHGPAGYPIMRHRFFNHRRKSVQR